MNNDINALALYLKQYVIDTSGYKIAYNEEQQTLIELVYASLDAGYNPKKILSQSAVEKFKELLGVDFNDEDFGSSVLENTSSDSEDPKEIKLNHKEILCSNFSLYKDLSDEYQYANPVTQTTCSHEAVTQHVCLIANRQDRCPYYTPDFQHFATYTLVQDSSVYFNIYRHRATTGFTVYTIYNDKNNLIHNLSYDSSTVYDHAKEDFNSELESIVLQNAAFIYDSPKFNHVYHNQKSEVVDKTTNSYIATLVSIS